MNLPSEVHSESAFSKQVVPRVQAAVGGAPLSLR